MCIRKGALVTKKGEIFEIKHEKDRFLTAELYHPVIPFDEKMNICETCHKQHVIFY